MKWAWKKKQKPVRPAEPWQVEGRGPRWSSAGNHRRNFTSPWLALAKEEKMTGRHVARVTSKYMVDVERMK